MSLRAKRVRANFSSSKDCSANGETRNTLPAILERVRYFSQSIYVTYWNVLTSVLGGMHSKKLTEVF